MQTIFRYLKLWILMSKNSFLTILNDRFGFFIFFLGKTVRFSLYFGFLYFLVSGTNTLAGYNIYQTLFFFLTFNVIDILSQFLFRGVYKFRPLVVSGSFDLVLVKPVNPLFRSLFGDADFIDFVTIPPLLFATYYVGSLLNPSLVEVFLYVLLLANGLLIATAFHIGVLALGIVTLEIDHTIMIYRDLVNMGRFPIDIYKEPLRSVLTFLIPVELMISLPTKSLLGLVSPLGVLAAIGFGMLALSLSLKFWNFALKKYSSASS